MTEPSSHPTEALLALVYGELSPEEARTVQRHVDGCAGCTATVAGYRAVRSATASLPRELPARSGLESVLHYGEQAAARARVRRGLRWVWPLAAGALAVWVGVVAVRPPAGQGAVDAVARREASGPGPAAAPVSAPSENERSKVAGGASTAPATGEQKATYGVGRFSDASKDVRAPARPAAQVPPPPARSERRAAAGAPLPAPKADAQLRSEEAPWERTDVTRQAEANVGAVSGLASRDQGSAVAEATLAKKAVAASPLAPKGKEALPILPGAAAPAAPGSDAPASIASADGGASGARGTDQARRATLHVRLRETQGAQLLPVLFELCGLEARLGHVQDAVGFCQRVVREYPGTPEAAAAQKQIELLRGGG